jgi:hypothetical protein
VRDKRIPLVCSVIVKRVLERLRAVWPETRIVLRRDGHFADPEWMQLALDDPHPDVVFGLVGNAVLARLARPPPTQLFASLQRRIRSMRSTAARPR